LLFCFPAYQVGPGVQGRNGFDFSAAGASGGSTQLPRIKPPPGGAVRRHYASVAHDASSGVVTVTVELVGGGGALVEVTGSDATALSDATYAASVRFTN
jgi:hypothetical protein